MPLARGTRMDLRDVQIAASGTDSEVRRDTGSAR